MTQASENCQIKVMNEPAKVLVIRPNSGLSGDILVAGLATLLALRQGQKVNDLLAGYLDSFAYPSLKERIRVVDRWVSGIKGVGLELDLPNESDHRHLIDIENFFAQSSLNPKAQELALKAFRYLAVAEAEVHGAKVEDVHFHEVGALDSIIDIGLASALLADLAPDRIVCGPLPICDGVIKCAHGLLAAPTPAVMKMLVGLPVVPLASLGETITPTAAAWLQSAPVTFGPWPSIYIEHETLAYGTRLLAGVPNGIQFAWGRSHALKESPSSN